MANSGFQTAADQAYDMIYRSILSGEFKPGEKLSRRKMAEFTGVSVIPVIEALNKLEDDGLVESKPQWGSFVTIPTEKKIRDMFVLREAIECMVARLLAENITKEQLEELKSIAEELDRKHTDESFPLISKNHYQFHYTMAKMTGYDSLINGLRRINLFWILCISASSTRQRRNLDREGWHERLLAAIEEGNPDEAEKMMRIHVNDAVELILEDIQ